MSSGKAVARGGSLVRAYIRHLTPRIQKRLDARVLPPFLPVVIRLLDYNVVAPARPRPIPGVTGEIATTPLTLRESSLRT